ncbi:hypothetical protein T439DRAFT_384076 [Meredithblackwellia eburnea MCA 4105]
MSNYSNLSTPEILSQLEHFRSINARKPLDVAQLGELVIERGWTSSKTEEVWTVLEQVAVAAVECGRLALAEVCAERLSSRFPGSPRVAVLLGMILEGKGLVEDAKLYYEGILLKNETDTPIRKRLIALHLSAPTSSLPTTVSKSKGSSTPTPSSSSLNKARGIELLVDYLDAVYNDAEGWAELASAYASLKLYPQSLSALSHLILLAPQNPYYLLRHAETAYTVGDFPLAYKEFLRVVEMSDGAQGKGGVGRRAAIGVKLTIARLEARGSDVADPVLKPQKLKEIDLLVSKLILDAYSNTPEAKSADVTRKWIGGTA